MKNDYRRFISLILVSGLIHIDIVLVWWFFKLETTNNIQNKVISVVINNKKNQPPPEQADQIEELVSDDKQIIQETAPEKIQPEIKAKAIVQESDMPDKYIEGEETESRNQHDKDITQLDYGANLATEREKIAKHQTELTSGVVTSKAESTFDEIKGESNDEALMHALGGVYNTFGFDEEQNDSKGELENAVRTKDEKSPNLNNINLIKELGNTTLLSDIELKDAYVEDPFTEKQGKEFKQINIYFKQITDVIFLRWINPLNPAQMKSGVSVKIRISLNKWGYLEEPEVYLQSQFPALDNSLIEAIRRSRQEKFNIPPSYLQKYSNLTLSWTSGSSEYELMPFEKESTKEKK